MGCKLSPHNQFKRKFNKLNKKIKNILFGTKSFVILLSGECKHDVILLHIIMRNFVFALIALYLFIAEISGSSPDEMKLYFRTQSIADDNKSQRGVYTCKSHF